MPHGNITYAWREPFTNLEIHTSTCGAMGNAGREPSPSTM